MRIISIHITYDSLSGTFLVMIPVNTRKKYNSNLEAQLFSQLFELTMVLVLVFTGRDIEYICACSVSLRIGNLNLSGIKQRRHPFCTAQGRE